MPRHRVRRSALPVSLTAAAVLAVAAAGGAYVVGRAPDRAPAAVASVSSASPSSEASEEPSVGLDTGSGTRAVYAGAEATYATASIVKVDILAALLLRAQDEGRALTADERSRAAAMIEKSDNDSATVLLAAVGGAARESGIALAESAAKAAVGVLAAR
ncbi:hypothetical protein [Streptomyces sp. 2131.1]|uniref:hypothetical protein n=1 Tax=Streptomyces sp. 2131.1 TaxID=1855346 RepID=UPI003525A443